MPALKDSKTEANLKEAFAGESQANRRYLYFAQKADVEGYPDVAALFRSVAEGETGHAFGHFDFLREVGDPVTGVPVGPTEDNLKSAIEGETYEYSEMYPGFARTARDEGFDRDRRVVRDPGPGREEPRRSVHRRTGLGRLTRLGRPAPCADGCHRLRRPPGPVASGQPARGGSRPQETAAADAGDRRRQQTPRGDHHEHDRTADPRGHRRPARLRARAGRVPLEVIAAKKLRRIRWGR